MGPSREDVRTLNIIIVGDGKVGYTLAEHLSREEHNVTIVDTSEEALRKADESLDVMCIKGNGASITALREAGADTADLLIAATSMDEINMVCCLTAKRLGTRFTIARVRNVEYTVDASALKHDMGIDTLINPENATAVEIARLLRFPSAANIETFYRGRVELMSSWASPSPPSRSRCGTSPSFSAPRSGMERSSSRTAPSSPRPRTGSM